MILKNFLFGCQKSKMVHGPKVHLFQFGIDIRSLKINSVRSDNDSITLSVRNYILNVRNNSMRTFKHLME